MSGTYSKKIFQERHSGYTCCGIFKANVRKEEKIHTHEFVEIVYILSGRAVQHINSSSFSVNRGDLLFINYKSKHSFEPKGSFEYINVGIQPEELSKYFSKYNNSFATKLLLDFNIASKEDERLITFYGQDRKEIESLLNIMLIENEKQSIHKEDNLKNCLFILLTLIIEKIRFAVDQKSHWDVVLDWINENLQEKITLFDVAKYCFYNPSYFSRIFKQRFGICFQKYLTTLRVARAKILLSKGMSIDKIVESAGFSSKKMFYKSFLEIEGQSVSDFRQQNFWENNN